MFSTCLNEGSACIDLGLSSSFASFSSFLSLFQYEKLPVPLAGGNYFRPFGGNGRGGGSLVQLFVGKVLLTGRNIPAIMGPVNSQFRRPKKGL
jgi:hypothetical protein